VADRPRRGEREDDERPPICPACGVTQGMVVEGDDVEFVCLECGFSDRQGGGESGEWVSAQVAPTRKPVPGTSA
jgi:Zn ribbon nucleic-acid-binding protein